MTMLFARDAPPSIPPSRKIAEAIKEYARRLLSLVVFIGAFVYIAQWSIPYSEMNFGAILDSYSFLLRGLGVSWLVTILAFLFSVIPAILLAFCRLSSNALLRRASGLFVELIRTTPELLIILWLFFLIPGITKTTINPFLSGTLALAFVNCAYLAEGMRAGILSVPKGLYLAGLATGLSPPQARLYIVTPIALRNMIPEVRNRIVSLFKMSALLYVIGLIEFFRALTIVNNREFAPLAAYITAAIVYFLCCYSIDIVGHKIETATQRHRRSW